MLPLSHTGVHFVFCLLVGLSCSGQTYTISTVAGTLRNFTGVSGPRGDGGPATAANLDAGPLALDPAGNLYISGGNRIRKVSAQGIITTIAGIDTPDYFCQETGGYSGDGGPAMSAKLNCPWGLAADQAGNVYIGDVGNYVIRKVTPGGIISTVAGTGKQGYSGDGGPAAKAEFTPNNLAMDAAGNLYISDTFSSVIRKISPDGLISTFAGNGVKGYTGDSGLATKASITNPGGLALDGAGNVFIADSGNNVVRKVDVAGTITTVAGNYNLPYEFSGDGAPATRATFQNPAAVATDSSGNLFIADLNSNRIREVRPNGIIVTVAGNGNYIFQGDGGPATNAGLQSPTFVLAAGANVYVSDLGHGLVRLLKPGAPVAGPPPVIFNGGVVPIFSSSPTIQASSWISIYGTNLTAGNTTIWNGDYPLALGDTTVTINNVAVPLSYVSPTLINAFVPAGAASGKPNVPVTVTAPNGTGKGVTAFAAASPSFCLLGDGLHVAGIILRSDGSGAFGGGTYDVIGPAGNSLGYRTVPAKAGDTIVVFGTGFGPTKPEYTIPLTQTTLALYPWDLVMGGTSVRPSFAGLSSPGLFQFNVTVPAGLRSGDLPFTAISNGFSTQKNVFIALQ